MKIDNNKEINSILEKDIDKLSEQDSKKVVTALINRFLIEFTKNDKSGIYAVTQYNLAYNSNRIEGSRLTKNQTVALFETRTLGDNDEYRAKDVEETTGHFLMFNEMLKTLGQDLSEELIKKFHYELKAGVFEDRANGYNIGEYKGRPNTVGGIITAHPKEVSGKMEDLIKWYEGQEKTITTMAEFHTRYETIHPFQDGNGRTGRLIIFRECLKSGIIPPIIKSERRHEYVTALMEYQQSGSTDALVKELKISQEDYYKDVKYFLTDYTEVKEVDKKITQDKKLKDKKSRNIIR